LLREAWGGNLDHRACTIIGCQDLLICFEFLTRRKCSSLCRYKHLTSARLVYGTTLYTMMVSTIYFKHVSRLSIRRHVTIVIFHCLTSMSVCKKLYSNLIEHDLQLGVRERERGSVTGVKDDQTISNQTYIERAQPRDWKASKPIAFGEGAEACGEAEAGFYFARCEDNEAE